MRKVLMIIGGIVLMFAIILGVTTCGILHVADEYIKEREPEVHQYVQMTETDQNAYVEKNMDELFMSISNEIKPDDENIDQAKLKEMENDPELRAAGIKLGRSILANFAMGSENISKELSDDDKKKYQAEADTLEACIDDYGKVMKKYEKAK